MTIKITNTSFPYATIYAIMLWLGCSCGHAYAADGPFKADDVSIGIGIENFRWQEYADSGQRLLTEQGLRLSLNASAGNFQRRKQGMMQRMAAKVVLGGVDYDGQDSFAIYTSTITDYTGWGIEYTLGFRPEPVVDRLRPDLVVGIGLDVWDRDIRNSVNALSQPVSGFTEHYEVYYGRLAVAGYRGTKMVNHAWSLGVKRALDVTEEIQILGQQVELNPGPRWSPFVTYRLGWRCMGNLWGSEACFVEMYYDGFRFSRSQTLAVGVNQVWQPRSQTEAMGIKFGYDF